MGKNGFFRGFEPMVGLKKKDKNLAKTTLFIGLLGAFFLALQESKESVVKKRYQTERQ